MKAGFSKRDIISITDFTGDDILKLCSQAEYMAKLEEKGDRYLLAKRLNQKALAYMFYEPSTRTKTSFNTAMRELGGSHDGFSGTEGTSVMKKETIRDTVMMEGANHFDVIVMRHPLDGSLQWAADVADVPVINGGDGKNEHPTQALLDIFTLYSLNRKKLNGLSIGFGGDLSHGRTIRSLSLALSHFDDITVRWAAEDFLAMPKDLEGLLKSKGVNVVREQNVADVMKGVRFYYMTRPQTERMKDELKLSDKDIEAKIMEMMQKYRIDFSKVDGFDVKLLHPLPINSEVAEIDYNAYFTPGQAFFKQAEFGIFLRKALLYEMLKDIDYVQFEGKLPESLRLGNNRLVRDIREKLKEHMFIDNIASGTVLDHLAYGSAADIADELRLIRRGFDSIPASLSKNRKSFIKTNLGELSERELKLIAMRSPDPSVNYIRDGKIAEKFVYLLCKNDNCVTRVINEDVPPKFYDDSGTVRCRYCRRQYEVTNPKVSAEEAARYKASLPKGIEKIERS
jgi:aspartate carbamoyltransferase catalytic subunit